MTPRESEAQKETMERVVRKDGNFFVREQTDKRKKSRKNAWPSA